MSQQTPEPSTVAAAPVPAFLSLASAVVVAALALVVSPVAYFLVLLAACVVATGEIFRIGRHMGATPVPLAGFAAVGALFALAYRGPDALLGGIPSVAAGCAAVGLIILVLRSKIAGALAAVALTVAASITIGVFGAFAFVLRQSPGGFRISIAFAAMVAANEAAARSVDALAGRRPVAVSIAPVPTWIGVAAGTAATAVAGVIAGATLPDPITTARAMVLAAVIAVGVPLGRIGIAMVRRGQTAGRVLGIIDGALFAAPLVYFAYRAMVR